MTEEQNPRDRGSTFRRFLWWLVVISFAAAGAILVFAVNLEDLHSVPWKLFLTCTGLAVVALLMALQNGALPRRSKTAILGALVIAVSQICFFLLVWTGWKQHSMLWRLWWVSMVPSVFVTHIMLLRAAALDKSRNNDGSAGMERVTIWFVLAAGLTILLLGFRKDLFGPLHPVYIVVGGVAALGTIAGSFYVVFTRLLGRVGAERLSKRALASGMLMSHLLLLVAGFYIGRATAGTSQTHPRDFVRQVPHDVKDKLDADIYKGQSKVATWLGDTRLVNREPYISGEQIEELSQKLLPGDIILERRNWYLSNPWLPGFWPHAALYAGTSEQLEKLGITGHPAIKKHWQTYSKPTENGHYYCIIEAVSEGVIINTLSHSLHADYVAVLRPRLPDEQKAAAITRAFDQLGKPYDFNFDFDDTSKLVCTQVIYVSYRGLLHFELKNIMGRNTLPANEIARKYVTERGGPDPQLEFTAFLDAEPAQQRALLRMRKSSAHPSFARVP